MAFESIVGQEHAIRLLTRMLQRDRLPHALLFTGIDGIGRQSTAKALAMALNCTKPPDRVSACRTCRSCRKVISGNHPDVITITPSGLFIRIGQVRSLRKKLRFAPMEGRRRVIIINDGQAMNPEASNAMLRILEEPPDNTHIILTASQATDLLGTIVSRCQHIAFWPIAASKIADVLCVRKGLDQDTATAIAILAKGSLGKALSADTKEWMGWRRSLLEHVGSISTVSTQALFAFAEALAHDKDKLQDALDMIIIWFRDILICKFCPEKVLNMDYMEDVQHKSRELSVEDLLGKIVTVFAAQRAILKNVNRRLALEVMMMRLCSDRCTAETVRNGRKD